VYLAQKHGNLVTVHVQKELPKNSALETASAVTEPNVVKISEKI